MAFPARHPVSLSGATGGNDARPDHRIDSAPPAFHLEGKENRFAQKQSVNVVTTAIVRGRDGLERTGMPRKPNYQFERSERAKSKAAKKAERLRAKAEKSEARKAEAAEGQDQDQNEDDQA
jgi:hypothetical protein